MVNIGTFLLIAIIMYEIYTKRTIRKVTQGVLVITAIVELTIERGYFIQIGNQQIAYRTICESILCVLCLICLGSSIKSIPKKIFNAFSYCVLCLIIGWGLLIIFPSKATGATLEVSWDEILVNRIGLQPIVFNTSMIIEIIQICMFLIILLTVYFKFTAEDYKSMFFRFLKLSKYVVFISTIEVITKKLFNSNIFIEVADRLLGTATASMTTLLNRGGGYALCGLTKESSHYVFSLTILIIMYYAERVYYESVKNYGREYKKTNVVLIILIIETLMSMSFSSIYYGILLILMFILIHMEKRGNSALKVMAFTIILVAVIAIGFKPALNLMSNLSTSGTDFWQRRFASLVEELNLLANGNWLTATTALEWSNRVRLGSTYETFKLVLYRPLFGVGLSAATAHSSLAMLVSGAGIIGTIAYINFISWIRNISVRKFNKSLFYSCLVIYLFMNIFNSLGLRPFYECWLIFLLIAFQYISEIRKQCD